MTTVLLLIIPLSEKILKSWYNFKKLNRKKKSTFLYSLLLHFVILMSWFTSSATQWDHCVGDPTSFFLKTGKAQSESTVSWSSSIFTQGQSSSNVEQAPNSRSEVRGVEKAT